MTWNVLFGGKFYVYCKRINCFMHYTNLFN